jgi:hypothetical protein
LGRVLLVPTLVLLVVAAVPNAAGSAALTGTATSCSQLASCNFVLNGTAGTGFASTSVFGWITFRLPGETNISHGSYAAKVVNQSGSIDHVLGTILATDANSGKIVVGSTDTYVKDTVHCGHTGCGHTYSLVNGTLRIRVTSLDATTTTVSCSPSSFSSGSSTRCTAKVVDLANGSLVPTGNVTFSTYAGAGTVGTFAHNGTCRLAAGTCSVGFSAADETVGTFQLFGTYHGFHSFYKSQGSTYISVTGN